MGALLAQVASVTMWIPIVLWVVLRASMVQPVGARAARLPAPLPFDLKEQGEKLHPNIL